MRNRISVSHPAKPLNILRQLNIKKDTGHMIYNEHFVSAKTARPQPERDLVYSDVKKKHKTKQKKQSPSGIWLSFTVCSYHKHSLKAAIQGINTPAAVNTGKSQYAQ